MSIDFPSSVGGHASSRSGAFYFASGDRRLFGWLHRPPEGIARDTALLICKPFGYEAICAFRSLRAFAEEAAAVGVPTLRFDYAGTGDSCDIDPRANQLELWCQDVIAAAEELQRVTGAERICVLGVRFGALLATLAALQCPVISRLILVSPIIKGRRYMRELRTARLAGALGTDAAGAVQNSDSDSEDGSFEASGYPFSAATIAGLIQVDLTASAPPAASHVLIIDGDTMPVARSWAESIRASDRRVEYAALPGLIEMIMAMPHDAKPPDAMLAAMRDWLVRVSNPAAPARHQGAARQAEANAEHPVLELPGESATAGISEYPVVLAAEPTIFGIVTETYRDEIRRRAVVLVSAGATYHAGPNRFYVLLARRWARCGYVVIRMDLAGLGDSGTRPGRPDNQVFPPSAVDDVRSAVEFVRRTYGIEDITLCGFCSGAYHALRSAVARMPVSRLLMVNPENFFWKEGTDLHSLEPAEVVKRTRVHRERIFSMRAWKRLMTGRIDILRILRIYLHRPLLALESELRDAARRLHLRPPRDLGWDLEEIGARGVRAVFVFARGEAGIDLLRIQAGVSLKRLGDRCRVHVIDSADHIFSQAGPRRILETILSNELFALNSRGTAVHGMELETGAIATSAASSVLSMRQDTQTATRHSKS